MGLSEHEFRCVVYPKPSPRGLPPPPLETDTGGAQDSMRGDEDFAGLRAFHPGDSPRRIAWKAYAREQGLQVKLYAGTAVTSHLVRLGCADRARHRGRLSQLCRWVEDAYAAGRAFGLRLPGVDIRTERRSGSSAALPDGAGAVRERRSMAERQNIALGSSRDVAAGATSRLGDRRTGAVGRAARPPHRAWIAAARSRRRRPAHRHRGQALAAAGEMGAQRCVAFAALLGVLLDYRTLNGIDAGTALLIVMAGMKLLETRTVRDLTVIVFLSYFALFAAFLYNQNLLRLPYMIVTAWLLTVTLMRIHQTTTSMSVREAPGVTGEDVRAVAAARGAAVPVLPAPAGPVLGGAGARRRR